MNAHFREQLENASQPIATATGLPSSLYVSPDAIETEKKSVFAPNWCGVGFAKDVPEPGDVKPVTFLGEPLIIAHGRDRQIRVFQNACRHRGVRLVEAQAKTTGLIRCPYHAWCYSTEGKLKQTPHVGGPGIHHHESIDKSTLGLVEVRSHVWRDVVFINLSGDAPAFEEAFKSLLKRWQDFEQPIYHGGEESSFKLELDTNWKLAVENYCESYHLPFIHPGLNECSRLEDHENIMGDGPWAGQLTNVFNPMLDENGRSFKEFAELPDKWDTAAEYLVAYPNVMLGVHKDHSYAIILEPLEAGVTHEQVEIYYASPDVLEDDWKAMRETNSAFWKSVFVEDVGVVEAMQAGRRASGFDGGHFSPVMDESTHHFHTWIAGQLMTAA